MKKFGAHFSLSTWWQYASTMVILGAGLSLLLISSIETLLPGYSAAEVSTAQSIGSFSHILSNPVNAPYNLVAYIFNSILDNALLSTRLTSVVFGVIMIGLLYIGTRHWYAPRTAFLATTLFACSAWFLHLARFGTPEILLPFSILLLAVSSYWIANAERSKLSYFAAMLAVGITIYTPGMIWLVAIGVYVRRKDIRLLKRRLPTSYRVALYASIALFIIAPIIFSIFKRSHGIFELLGLPSALPTITQFLKNLAEVPLTLFAWSSENPQMTLGNLPLLDSFAIIMVPLGLYFYFKFRTLLRVKLLLAASVICWILIGLGGPVTIAVLLPITYIIVAAGIALLLSQWLVVFPRNPFAKSVGIILITLVVALSCIYNLRSYFTAWPNNAQTKAEFSKTSENLVQ
jgi:4-amino-4-deoxy-L-arabinose transferase-like glycosyltransferase